MQSSWRESRSLPSTEIYRLIPTCEMIRTHSCHGCSLGQITSLAKGASERSIWMREKKQTGAIDFSPVGSTSLGFWLTEAVCLLWGWWLLPNWLALTLPSLINIHFLLSNHSPSMGFFLIETQEFWYQWQPLMLHRAHPDSVTLFPCVVHLHVNFSTWSLRISTVKSGTFPPLSVTKAQFNQWKPR